MKKTIAFLLALAMVLSLAPMAMAADPTSVTVTIATAGKLQLVQKSVSVTDQDSDGKLTINDVLICAHVQYYSGGKSGYATAKDGSILYPTKLWGVSNGEAYGCYKNNQMVSYLEETVKAGDSVYAYAFKDLTTYSDSYSWFDKATASVKAGEAVSLTLKHDLYDEEYKPETSACEGAIITVNGTETLYTTDEDGQVEISFDKAGTYTVSAVSDIDTLVPPVCIVTVTGGSASSTNPFTDVADTYWGKDYILKAVNAGLFAGLTKTTFGPENNMTRAQLVTVLYRMNNTIAEKNGGSAAKATSKGYAAARQFKDVDAKQYYFDAVAWAVENGVMTGYSSTKFGTNDPVTREQLMTVLYRIAGSPAATYSISAFSDASTISSWANSAIRWGVGTGLLSGSNGKLMPQGKATRAQVAKILVLYWPQD